MSRTASNLTALVFALVLTGLTFQQTLVMPGATRPSPTGYVLA
ncbi:hypothetical protein ACWPM1_02980 [Tsuneonella sp. HG249]